MNVDVMETGDNMKEAARFIRLRYIERNKKSL
jgi:hypothetical protein